MPARGTSSRRCRSRARAAGRGQLSGGGLGATMHRGPWSRCWGARPVARPTIVRDPADLHGLRGVVDPETDEGPDGRMMVVGGTAAVDVGISPVSGTPRRGSRRTRSRRTRGSPPRTARVVAPGVQRVPSRPAASNRSLVSKSNSWPQRLRAGSGAAHVTAAQQPPPPPSACRPEAGLASSSPTVPARTRSGPVRRARVADELRERAAPRGAHDLVGRHARAVASRSSHRRTRRPCTPRSEERGQGKQAEEVERMVALLEGDVVVVEVGEDRQLGRDEGEHGALQWTWVTRGSRWARGGPRGTACPARRPRRSGRRSRTRRRRRARCPRRTEPRRRASGSPGSSRRRTRTWCR